MASSTTKNRKACATGEAPNAGKGFRVPSHNITVGRASVHSGSAVRPINDCAAAEWLGLQRKAVN